ncbi:MULTISPECIES: copper resistance CopC family protein [Microbacterium]|uniref:Copper resistance protein CopC n=1 Tax=Microbacterium testaceum TaxID=2033 RepID=A0A147FB88_MICTE|nr:copper resistance CopC family protein [Microbacterium testaceum]KTS13843.1 copper resistance protein CopC [Microbacterium testaceum]
MIRLRAVAVGCAVAVVVVLTSVVPASAHDQLLSSSPASGERLPSAPEEITLTFSADVLDVGADIIVADAEGTDWAVGDPAIASATVAVGLTEGMPAAGYEVRWRVVSSDGHPISGVIPFTVGDAAPLERAPASASAPAVAAPVADDPGIPRIVVVAALGAGIALAALLLVSLLRRAARGRQPGKASS